MQNMIEPDPATAQEKQILVLQGGGALGAYQAGAYEALLRANVEPKWVAGISIGAINGALIAGNPREKRIAALHTFWSKVSSGLQGAPIMPGLDGRTVFNELSSWSATMFGIHGFFSPRAIAPFYAWPGSTGSTSFYNTEPLALTLNALVDFDLINTGGTRLSVGAVNVRTGNFKYFDSKIEKLRAEHVMASGALPPGFPAIQIEGEYYWDGGLVSNTPLNYVIENAEKASHLCIYQLDLFSSTGVLPMTIMEAAEREKEIRFSSRTRGVTKSTMADIAFKKAAKNLVKKLPPEWLEDKDVKTLFESCRDGSITVMHLINRASATDTQSKDYDFSRLSMQEHWKRGFDAASASLNSRAWNTRAIPARGMVTFDQEKVVRSET
jgi:NTE family protein